MSKVSYQDVVRILKLVEDSNGLDLDLTIDDLSIRVSRTVADTEQISRTSLSSAPPTRDDTTAAPASDVAETPAPPALKASEFPNAKAVKAPMGGVFYASPSPGTQPFVNTGDRVEKGQQLGIVEVMKLFTPILAEASGVVLAILVENQQTIAKDDTLVLIDSDG